MEKYYEDEEGNVIGSCDKHGEFIGDAVGCPKCLGESVESEVISSYTSNQGIEDGVLMENPKINRFSECNIITTNLWEKIREVCMLRNMSEFYEIEPLELLGSLMLFAENIYTNKKFEGDNDENFFVIPPTEEGLKVWFVKNEFGKLTAMLPEDY